MADEDGREDLAAMEAGTTDDVAEVFDTGDDLAVEAAALFLVVGARIEVGLEGVADLLDLCLGPHSLVEDQEH